MKMVKVEFGYALLVNRSFKAEHLSQILDHFPQNTFIVNISSGNSNSTEIFFESQEFDEVLPGQNVPTLQALFTTCADGSVECVSVGPWRDGLDTSKIFTSSNTNGINLNVNSSSYYTTDINDYDYKVDGSGSNSASSSSTNAGCSHEWGEYRGIFENYKYCKKCNVKGDKIDP